MVALTLELARQIEEFERELVDAPVPASGAPGNQLELAIVDDREHEADSTALERTTSPA